MTSATGDVSGGAHSSRARDRIREYNHTGIRTRTYRTVPYTVYAINYDSFVYYRIQSACIVYD